MQSGGMVWEEGWEITGCQAGMGGIVGSSRALNVCTIAPGVQTALHGSCLNEDMVLTEQPSYI